VQALQDSGRGEAVDLVELYRGARQVHRVEAVEWLVCDLGFPISADDCATWRPRSLGYHAAARGAVRLLQHLRSKGLHTLSPADKRAVLVQEQSRYFGVPRGTRSTEVVRWLHAQDVSTRGPRGPGLDFEDFKPQPQQPAVDAADFLTFEAARQGALELLRVLVEECGAHWTESVCVAAAENGHMEVLRWALSKHCPCAADTWCASVRRAGKHNDYRPLALLHSAKRPWDETVWIAAAPDEEVRTWLKKRGCPGSQETPAAGAGAVAAGVASVGAVAVA